MRAHEITGWRSRADGDGMRTITAECTCRRWSAIESHEVESLAAQKVAEAYVQHTVDEAIMDGRIPTKPPMPAGDPQRMTSYVIECSTCDEIVARVDVKNGHLASVVGRGAGFVDVRDARCPKCQGAVTAARSTVDEEMLDQVLAAWPSGFTVYGAEASATSDMKHRVELHGRKGQNGRIEYGPTLASILHHAIDDTGHHD